jgi:hypothetical protein
MSARVDRLNELFDQFTKQSLTASISTNQNMQQQATSTEAAADISRADMASFIEIVTTLHTNDGWSAVRLASNRSTLGNARSAYAAYLDVYMKAYFRNEFGSLGVQFSDLYTRYPELKKFQDKLDPILKEAQKDLSYGKVSSGAFVGRTGRQLQFPPLEITIDPTKHTAVTVSKIDYAEVGADLVRVVVEALFDARDRLPAVQNATGAIAANFDPSETSYPLATFKPSQGLGPYERPVYAERVAGQLG